MLNKIRKMMKRRKLLAVLACVLMMCTKGLAQNVDNVNSYQQSSYNEIWKQRKHLTFGIGSQKLTNLSDEDSPVLKSTIALSLQTGRTYHLHKKPLANIIKFGLDWNQMELHFAKYKKLDEEYDGSENGGSGDHLFNGNLGDLGLSDLGFYQLDYGMAVGPSIQITPLYNIGNGLEFIKVYTHFHVIPSYSIIFLSSPNDTNLGYGYVTSFNWGIGIAYRSFAIGFETRWGKGKYNTSAFNNEINEGTIIDGISSFLQNNKTKYKTASSKLTLSLRF